MIMKGDATLNYKVDVEDVELIKANLLGLITLTGDAFRAADTNSDGVINARDLANIQMHKLGISIITEVIE